MKSKLFLFIFFTLLINKVMHAQTEQQIFTDEGKKIISLFVNRNYDSLQYYINEPQKIYNSPAAISSNYEPIIEKYGNIQTVKFAGFKGNNEQITVQFVCNTAYNIGLLVELIFNTKNKKIIYYKFTETYKIYAIPEYVNAELFTENTINFHSDSTMPLTGFLTMPVIKEKVPLIIIIPDAGPTDADGVYNSKPYKDIAYGLSSYGFATFRYNKRSINYGFNLNQDKVNNKVFTPNEDVIDDLLSGIEALKGNPNIDTTKIYLLGHGEGAYLAPYIANNYKNICGIIMINANANHPLEMIMEQHKYLGKILPHKKEHFDEDDLKAKKVLKGNFDSKTHYAELPFDVPASYWLWINNYSQVKIAKKLSIPIFIIQGERNYQVDKANFYAWKKKLKRNKNVSFKNYESLNHIMHDGVGESTYSEYGMMVHIPFFVIDDLQKWLKVN
jgi:dienelactone hydrolase